MEARRVLVVDDKATARSLVRRILEPLGYEIVEASSVSEALTVHVTEHPDVVLTDLKMPGEDGIAGVRQLRAIDPELPIIMITAYGTIETALEATRLGVFDYLQKPIEPSVLEHAVERAYAHKQLLDDNRRLREELSGTRGHSKFITRSSQMIELLRGADRAAGTDLPVLIQGESGTGKELLARRVHALSRRSKKVFLCINCAAIPENLLESELFGYERGAFSGATEARAGFFTEANGGTLLLDEIGDLSLGLQPKLLRILEEGEYFTVGGRKPKRCDVRTIFSTHRNLTELVKDGRFREDLYYRIDRVRLKISPLRERADDIPVLAQHFFEQARKSVPTEAVRIGTDAMNRLLAFRWPGNVRQLAAVIERACLTASGPEIRPSDLPEELSGTAVSSSSHVRDYRAEKDRFEEDYLRRLMDSARGQVAEAARISGLHRATLYEKLARFGIEKEPD